MSAFLFPGRSFSKSILDTPFASSVCVVNLATPWIPNLQLIKFHLFKPIGHDGIINRKLDVISDIPWTNT